MSLPSATRGGWHILCDSRMPVLHARHVDPARPAGAPSGSVIPGQGKLPYGLLKSQKWHCTARPYRPRMADGGVFRVPPACLGGVPSTSPLPCRMARQLFI